MRTSRISRETKETQISLTLCLDGGETRVAVSYTHLTLPTICSV